MNENNVVLIFGASGLAGRAISRIFRDEGFGVIEAPSHSVCDASNLVSVIDYMQKLWITPSVVINCVANTNVDADPYERIGSNIQAPCNIGRACIDFKVPLFIHVSTDYVYNRSAIKRIEENDMNYSPCNSYGREKLAADMALVGMYDNWNLRNPYEILKLRIVRTSSLYGPDRDTFVDGIINAYLENGTYKALQTGSSIPTSTRVLAKYMVELVRRTQARDESVNDPTRYFRNCVCDYAEDVPVSRLVCAHTICNFLKEFEIPGNLNIEGINDWDLSQSRPLASNLYPGCKRWFPDVVEVPYWEQELKEYVAYKIGKTNKF